jgi:phosphatidylglycerol---prolipoprotein diacylglyceryl transferase
MIPWFDVPVIRVGGLVADVPAGLGVAGAIAAMVFVRYRARRAGLSVRPSVDGLVWIIGSALFFGHTLDVLLYRSGDLAADWRLIAPWAGGYCSLGACLGVVIAIVLRYRAPGGSLAWDAIDQAVLALLLGLGITRVGCFLGHHHAGRLSSFVLAVAYPGGARHDLGLYEALLVFALLCLLVVAERRQKEWPPGVLSASAVFCYGLGRFTLEFLRGGDLERIGRHSDPRYLGLTLMQYGALVAAGAAVALWRHRARPSELSHRTLE